jgi:hypothetical protein
MDHPEPQAGDSVPFDLIAPAGDADLVVSS